MIAGAIVTQFQFSRRQRRCLSLQGSDSSLTAQLTAGKLLKLSRGLLLLENTYKLEFYLFGPIFPVFKIMIEIKALLSILIASDWFLKADEPCRLVVQNR